MNQDSKDMPKDSPGAELQDLLGDSLTGDLTEGRESLSKEGLLEEFEFKPLTEGLGFHRKSIDLQTEVESSGLLADQTQPAVIPGSPDDLFADSQNPSLPSIADLTPFKHAGAAKESAQETAASMDALSPEIQRPDIHQPLPREKTGDSSTIMDRVQPALTMDFVETAEKSKELNKEILQETATEMTYRELKTNITSAIFDAVVGFTFSILFLVAMVSITHVDLVALVFNAKTQLAVQGSLLLMYIAILELYMIVSRVVVGSTLGEWAFDVHLAEKENQRGSWYAMKVIWRGFLTAVTGFVVLPLLSLIFRQDLLGRLSGTRLYQLQ